MDETRRLREAESDRDEAEEAEVRERKMRRRSEDQQRQLEGELFDARREKESIDGRLNSAMFQIVEAYKRLEKAMVILDTKQEEFNIEIEDVKDRLLHWLEQNHGDYIRFSDHDC